MLELFNGTSISYSITDKSESFTISDIEELGQKIADIIGISDCMLHLTNDCKSWSLSVSLSNVFLNEEQIQKIKALHSNCEITSQDADKIYKEMGW